MNKFKNPSLVMKALRYMVQVVVAEERTVTYGELAKHLEMHHRHVKYVCDAMGKYCRTHDLPRLNALVVNAKSQVPSKGWVNYQINTLGDNVTFEEEQRKAWLFDWPAKLTQSTKTTVDRPDKLDININITVTVK